jgi:hypothetical protein
MDDYGNDIMADYWITRSNPYPVAFNWTAYCYYVHPEYVKINWG